MGVVLKEVAGVGYALPVESSCLRPRGTGVSLNPSSCVFVALGVGMPFERLASFGRRVDTDDSSCSSGISSGSSNRSLGAGGAGGANVSLSGIAVRGGGFAGRATGGNRALPGVVRGGGICGRSRRSQVRCGPRLFFVVIEEDGGASLGPGRESVLEGPIQGICFSNSIRAEVIIVDSSYSMQGSFSEGVVVLVVVLVMVMQGRDEVR